MDDILVAYFRAWNEHDPDERRRLLNLAVTEDAVLIDPTGSWEGAAGLAERIGRYHEAAPGTVVVTASDVGRTQPRRPLRLEDRQSGRHRGHAGHRRGGAR